MSATPKTGLCGLHTPSLGVTPFPRPVLPHLSGPETRLVASEPSPEASPHRPPCAPGGAGLRLRHRRAGRGTPLGLAVAHQLSGAHPAFAWGAQPPHPTHCSVLSVSGLELLWRTRGSKPPKKSGCPDPQVGSQAEAAVLLASSKTWSSWVCWGCRVSWGPHHAPTAAGSQTYTGVTPQSARPGKHLRPHGASSVQHGRSPRHETHLRWQLCPALEGGSHKWTRLLSRCGSLGPSRKATSLCVQTGSGERWRRAGRGTRSVCRRPLALSATRSRTDCREEM